MALPPSLATRTIHGAWVKSDGTPESGTVLYTTTGYTRFPADNVVMSPARFLGTMNGSGEVTITNVPVNDDPDGDPAVGGYLETVTYSDGRVTSRVIIISIDDPATVEVADKPAASVAVPLAQYATLDGTGNVPFSQLGNIPAGSNDPATGSTYGTVILAGDLSGVASAPTVVGLATALADISSLSSAVSSKAEDSAVVHLTGAETVAGIKTFSASPIVPTPTTSFQAATKGYADSVGGTVPDADAVTKGKVQLAGALGGTAASPTTPTAVHLTGAETVAGVKTFSSLPSIPVTPSASTDAASKGYVDGLDAVDVKLTGAQTVAGVKTFSSSPVVPTPSGGTDASNKAYADTKATDSLAAHLAGTETFSGAKTFSAAMTINSTVARTGTVTFTAPNDTTVGTIYSQPNTVTTVGSSNMTEWKHKGVLTGRANEWGGYRVDVPSVATVGYADVGIKIKECPDGGEDGFQVFGPGGTKKFYVRDGKALGANLLSIDNLDLGYKAWNFGPFMATSGSVLPTAGQLFVVKVKLATPETITNIHMHVITAGTVLTAGQNFAALYNSGGTLISGSTTADQTTPWGSTGAKVMALGTPYVAAAGTYYVGLWYNGTTSPAFLRLANLSNANGIATGSSSAWATTNQSATTTAPGTSGTLTAASIAPFVGFS